MVTKFMNALRGIFIYFFKDVSSYYHIGIYIFYCILTTVLNEAVKPTTILLIGIVIAFEWVNTLIEKTIDYISTERNNFARDIKDLSAGVVLFVSIIVYGFMFIPIILKLVDMYTRI